MTPTRKLCVLVLLCASGVLVAQSSDASKPAANAVEKKANRKASQDDVSRRSKSSEQDKSAMVYDKTTAAAPAAASPTASASPRPYTAQSSGDNGDENTTPVPVGTTPPTPQRDAK